MRRNSLGGTYRSYPEPVDGLVPGVLHLVVVGFFALQNVDLLGKTREEDGESERVWWWGRTRGRFPDLIFGLEQGLQLLQGLGQLVLQQLAGAVACVGLQVSHLPTQKLDTPEVRQCWAGPGMSHGIILVWIKKPVPGNNTAHLGLCGVCFHSNVCKREEKKKKKAVDASSLW